MIKEIKDLANILNITESNSIELINFYFGNYADSWVYQDFLTDEVRIIKDTKENQGFNTSGLTYYQNKDYSDDLIKQLIDKCGWEIIIERLINLESSEILCVDYQLEEYKFIVYDDKIKAFNDIKNNIISIETNTDLFNEYNNEISKTIDKYWDIIDFDYDNYYGLMR